VIEVTSGVELRNERYDNQLGRAWTGPEQAGLSGPLKSIRFEFSGFGSNDYRGSPFRAVTMRPVPRLATADLAEAPV